MLRRIARAAINDKANHVTATHKGYGGWSRVCAPLGAAGDMQMLIGGRQRREFCGETARRDMAGRAALSADTGADASARVGWIGDKTELSCNFDQIGGRIIEQQCVSGSETKRGYVIGQCGLGKSDENVAMHLAKGQGDGGGVAA